MNLTQAEQEQYDKDILRGIQVGDIVYRQDGYRSCSGAFKVTEIFLKPHSQKNKYGYSGYGYGARLQFRGKRVMKIDGTVVKNTKTIQTHDINSIGYKITAEWVQKNFESELKSAEEKRDILMSFL